MWNSLGADELKTRVGEMVAGNTDAVLALYRQTHPGMSLAEPVIAPRNRTLEQTIASHAGRPQIAAQEAPARISYGDAQPSIPRKNPT